jgi:uncharacterized lipoprotein YmbA
MPANSLSLGLVMLLTISACSSQPVRFHTLMQPPGKSITAQNQAEIRIDNVLVPAAVDRSELVVRQGPTDLVVLSSDWWGASLSEEIRSALTARFATAAGNSSVVSARIQVTRFDVIAGEGAWLESRYRLTGAGPEGRDTLQCASRLHSDADSRVTSLVKAQQENLEILATEMLAAAVNLTEGKSCP